MALRSVAQFVRHYHAIARRGLADPDSREWTRLALQLWFVFAVVISIKTFVSPERHTVYTFFDQGAIDWFEGKSLYTRDGMSNGFRYPPTYALAFAPLAVLPRALGGTLWSLLSLGMLLWGLRLFARDVFAGAWTRRGEAVLLALALLISVRGLWAAQSNSLIIALALLAAAMIVRQAWWRAAMCLALPVYIKIWPIAAALVLVACWPRQLTLRWLAIMIVLAVIPFAAQRPAYVLSMYQEFGELLGGPWQSRWSAYRDAWTIWETVQTPDPQVFRACQLGAAAAVLAACLWKRITGAPVQRVLLAVIALYPAWQLLFGPASERNTYGLLAPALALGIVQSSQQGRGRSLAGLALGCFVMGSLGVERSLTPYLPAAKAMLPLGVIIYLAWLFCYGWRETSTPTSTEGTSNSPPHALRPHILAKPRAFSTSDSP
jgi:hypothetical protein